MNDKEMISMLIDQYTNLQRIKIAQDNTNSELEYQLQVIRAKLESFGIPTTKLDLSK